MREPKQVLVWRNGRHEVKTLPFSAGGRVGRSTENHKEAMAMYDRIIAENKAITRIEEGLRDE